jgi:hypothetical protein
MDFHQSIALAQREPCADRKITLFGVFVHCSAVSVTLSAGLSIPDRAVQDRFVAQAPGGQAMTKLLPLISKSRSKMSYTLPK